ncbi:MAG: hypothetical protein KH301_06035 [Brachyspira sp.]|nr:hypothetical protein [Brachyspira sp.]
MKNFLVLTSILTVIFIAFIDTKARINELDEIAATTQVQVERKPEINKSSGEGVMHKFETMDQKDIIPAPKVQPLQTQQNNLSPQPQNKFNTPKYNNYMP